MDPAGTEHFRLCSRENVKALVFPSVCLIPRKEL